MKAQYWTRLLLIAGFGTALTLGVMGGSAAGQDSAPAMEHAGMAMPMKADDTMAMHATMQTMDEKLDALVVEMNSAAAGQKADAVAAVVTELVSQRKAMHEMMMKMSPEMMDHMRSMMSEGMSPSMVECPMMQKMSAPDEQGGEDDHSAHHSAG